MYIHIWNCKYPYLALWTSKADEKRITWALQNADDVTTRVGATCFHFWCAWAQRLSICQFTWSLAIKNWQTAQPRKRTDKKANNLIWGLEIDTGTNICVFQDQKGTCSWPKECDKRLCCLEVTPAWRSRKVSSIVKSWNPLPPCPLERYSVGRGSCSRSVRGRCSR